MAGCRRYGRLQASRERTPRRSPPVWFSVRKKTAAQPGRFGWTSAGRSCGPARPTKRPARPAGPRPARAKCPTPAGPEPAMPVNATPGGLPPRSGPCHASRRDHGRCRRVGDTSRPCLTFVTLRVLSPARLAERLPRMADCPSCSVELSMLRASRREDRKRVPQYSSSHLS